jgi:CheY-like chemotaxis protein
VARVLIADDNSNIQKMVSLALKEAGIEVVAVGNGEAAVRKMPEVLPDLVLADIFMPVRNGYEVCEFVKHDPRYMHVPVVLLIGAFDPFDEHEAQRVQADGVLKKPFIPPDPLVRMVTALLAKTAGEHLVAVGVTSSTSNESEAGGTHPVRQESAAPFAGATQAEIEMPMASSHFVSEDTSAYDTEFESPTAQEVNEMDAVVTSKRDPTLGDPSFWASAPATEAPSPEELTDGHKWDGAVSEDSEKAMLQPVDTEMLADTTAFQSYEASYSEPPPHTIATPEIATPAPMEHDDGAYDDVTGHDGTMPELESDGAEKPVAGDLQPFEWPADDSWLAHSPLPPWASQPSEKATHPEAQALALPDSQFVLDEEPPTQTQPPETASVLAAIPEPSLGTEPAALPEPSSPAIEEDPSAHGDSQPTHLESAAAPGFESAFALKEQADTPGHEPLSEPAHFSVMPSMIEAVTQDNSGSALADEIPATHTPPNPELIEAVVARVIDRMQPKMIEIITREVLRPVIEVLVRRELERQ